MFELLALGVLGTLGYMKSRKFVRERLRFVDVAHKSVTPWAIGAVTTLAAAPVVALLPVVTGITAVGMGVAVGAGVAAGSRDSRRLPRA